MTNSTSNLRKAAVLLRSLDADTAATLLTQLSPAEAQALRDAIRALGPVDDDERADVAAEFRRFGSQAASSPGGVVLELSAETVRPNSEPATAPTGRPFEFLELARVEALVPYLAREHGQTVAIVLAYLTPARAAQVLAALPARLQADVVDRLSNLGEIDPASVQVLERELADWLHRQQATRSRDVRRTDAVAAILAAADATTRDNILANVARHNRRLAEQVSPPPEAFMPIREPDAPLPQSTNARTNRLAPPAVRNPQPEIVNPRPAMRFDELTHLDPTTLTAVLRAVDADLMVLALAGASDALVDRIADSMPRPAASAFRRRLRQIGPTRLSDVEVAQREVASVAAETIQRRATAFQSVGN